MEFLFAIINCVLMLAAVGIVVYLLISIFKMSKSISHIESMLMDMDKERELSNFERNE